MYPDKTLLVQKMDFLPGKTFHRIVTRYRHDYQARKLRFAKQSIMAFAQLTSCESLRGHQGVSVGSNGEALLPGH